jgi:hypothetical protein
MFFWLTALLTFLVFPLALIVGKPVRITTVKALTPHDFHKKFPLSRLTPIIWMKPWPWFEKHMVNRINAYAFLGLIIVHNEQESTIFHEAIHVTHQSIFSPILYAAVYVLDWLMYAPFHSWFRKGAWRRVPVGETVAYRIANDDPHLAP